MVNRKPFPRKLKPPMEYMIESIEEHTIELEKILLTVKEISDRLDILIDNDGRSASSRDRARRLLGESTKLDIE